MMAQEVQITINKAIEDIDSELRELSTKVRQSMLGRYTDIHS